MLSKSAAKKFFIIGTVVCSGTFLVLTFDTIRRVPAQTNEQNLSPQVIHGKNLWDKNNCMGCHTILGEGAYYAPELTKVYERRGPAFIKAMIKDPQAMYPGQRRMEEYDFTDEELDALVAFFKWIGEMDLNGWPPKPDLNRLAVQSVNSETGGAIAELVDRPKVYNQMCIACHALQGQGGTVGPALDGIGDRKSYDDLVAWLKDPQAVKPGSLMPKLPLSETDVSELAAFLSKVTASGGAK